VRYSAFDDGAFQGEVAIAVFWGWSAATGSDEHDVLTAHYIDGLPQPLGSGRDGA